MSVTDIVNEWAGQLSSGALARSTPAYNEFHAALPALIAALDPASVQVPAEPKPAADPVPAKKTKAPPADPAPEAPAPATA